MSDPLPGRRRWLLAALSMATAALLPGCSRDETLVVGLHPWIGYELFYLGRSLGWLPDTVVISDGSSASSSMAALAQGRVDAAALTLDETLRARADGVPLRVVAVLDVSAGADVVLARPGWGRLSALAGARIGVEHSAVGELMLDGLLQAAGLARQDLDIQHVPLDAQLQTWRAGSVDVVVSYEPMASLLAREGAQRIFDSSRLQDTIFDVLVVRDDRRPSRGAALTDLLTAHFLALRHLRSSREDAIYRIAARQGVAAGEVERALAGVMLPDLDWNRRYLAPGSALAASAARLNALMLARGMLPRPDPLQGMFVADYLPQPADLEATRA